MKRASPIQVMPQPAGHTTRCGSSPSSLIRLPRAEARETSAPGRRSHGGTRWRVSIDTRWRRSAKWDWRPTLSGLTAPALVIHGTEDVFPVERAREWVAALPNGRLLLLEGVGHFPYLEAPETFLEAAEDFIRGGWPTAAEG